MYLNFSNSDYSKHFNIMAITELPRLFVVLGAFVDITASSDLKIAYSFGLYHARMKTE